VDEPHAHKCKRRDVTASVAEVVVEAPESTQTNGGNGGSGVVIIRYTVERDRHQASR
jgi:hypothetical protein